MVSLLRSFADVVPILHTFVPPHNSLPSPNSNNKRNKKGKHTKNLYQTQLKHGAPSQNQLLIKLCSYICHSSYSSMSSCISYVSP